MPDKKRRRHPAPPLPIDRPFPDLPSSIAREGSSSSVDEEVLAAACWIERYEVEAVAGPLPSAAELARYVDILPASGEAILGEWRSEGSHRRALEAEIVRAEIEAQTRGQHYAFAVMVLGLVIGGVLIFTGHDVAGAAIAGTDLVAAATIFLTSRRRAEAESAARPESSPAWSSPDNPSPQSS